MISYLTVSSTAKAVELFTKGFMLGVTAYKAAKSTNRKR